MALYKIGKSYYNGTERPICLLQGTAVRDGEDSPVNGKDHAKVSVAAQKNEAGDTLFVTVNGWRDRAREVAAIQKLDSILAVGVLKERFYNERKYYDLDADFICISGVGCMPLRASGRAAGGGVSADFEELDGEEEGELPF